MITKVLTQGILFTCPWVLNETSFDTYLSQLLPGATPSTLSDISTNIYPPPSASANLPYTTDLDWAALLTAEVMITIYTFLPLPICTRLTTIFLMCIPRYTALTWTISSDQIRVPRARKSSVLFNVTSRTSPRRVIQIKAVNHRSICMEALVSC